MSSLEESAKNKKWVVMGGIPIIMLILNSLFRVEYKSDSAFLFVAVYFIGYFSFLGFFVCLVLIFLNQHKLLEFQKTYIDIALVFGIVNILVSMSSYFIVKFL